MRTSSSCCSSARREFLQDFTRKELCDAKQCTEVLVCLSRDSREAVDAMAAAAVAAGGATPNGAKDFGFMYQHGFEDLDGHLWKLVYMAARTGSREAGAG